MEYIFYKPKSIVLQKYIEGYYFLSADCNSTTIHYRTFPNNFNILSVDIATLTTYSKNKVKVIPVQENLISSSLTYSYTSPLEIIIEPPLNELTMYFKPLGLNRFIDNLEQYFNQKDSTYFFPFDDFEVIMRKILTTNQRENQIENIEKYWLSKLLNKDFSAFEKFLEDIDKGLNVAEISIKNNISRQYLSRIFKKYIGKSLADYRKIKRFREGLISKMNSKNLTAVTYDAGYYDQSHYIKDFKRITNYKPRTFFQRIDINRASVWDFL